jgi:hypothetical protein
MIIHPNAAGRRRLDHGERGAATLETVGMYIVAALLAVAVLLAATGSAPMAGDRFRQAVCMVTTLGQGSCESSLDAAGDREPTAPCVLTADGHTGAIEAGIVVSFGGSEQFLVEKLSNGKSRVTRAIGGQASAGVGAGFNVSATLHDKTYGTAAAAGASVAATFSAGEVYYANNEDEVANLLKAHQEAVAKDVLGSRPLGSVAVSIVNFAEDTFDLGHDFPPVAETYSEGGAAGELSAQVAALTGSAEAVATADAVLGIRQGADGTSTTYYQVSGDLNLGAGLWASDEQTGETAYGKVALERKEEAVFEVERDAKGIITAVRVKSVSSGNTEATADEGKDTGPGENAYYTETVSELPTHSATDQAIAQRFLNGAGLGPMGGFKDLPEGAQSSLPVMNPLDAMQAAEAFGQATSKRGQVTEQTFDDSKSNASGVKFDARYIARINGSVTVETVGRRSTGLKYWNGAKMLPKIGCGE